MYDCKHPCSYCKAHLWVHMLRRAVARQRVQSLHHEDDIQVFGRCWVLSLATSVHEAGTAASNTHDRPVAKHTHVVPCMYAQHSTQIIMKVAATIAYGRRRKWVEADSSKQTEGDGSKQKHTDQTEADGSNPPARPSCVPADRRRHRGLRALARSTACTARRSLA